jgi:hypothetical protein
MKINLFIRLIAVLLFISSCNVRNPTEIVYNKYDNIVDIQPKIVDIKSNIIFGNSDLYVFKDYLLVSEGMPSSEKSIHIFNKNSFNYITSTCFIGKGPGEVTNKGPLCFDENSGIFLVSDYSKMVLWKFPLDSVIQDANYKPTRSIPLSREFFVVRFEVINDSLILGKAVQPSSASKYEMKMVKFNINTGGIQSFGYEHPEAVGQKPSNSFFKVNVNSGYYVNCYLYADLITVCDLNGVLKYNIYGPDWVKTRILQKITITGLILLMIKL